MAKNWLKRWHPSTWKSLGVKDEELEDWHIVASDLVDGYCPETRKIEEFADYFKLEDLNSSDHQSMAKTQIINQASGCLNVDFQMRVKRHPERGETLLAENYLMASGGKGANVAFIARRLGVEARLLARFGDDPLAEEALRPLRQIGVDLSFTKSVKGQSTGASFIAVQPDGNKTIILATNANESWTVADTDEVIKVIHQAPADSILVTDLEVFIDVVRQALVTARQRELRTVLDSSPAERMAAEIYPLVDFITPQSS